jgi:Reverse transcriptase (RNA-dependent DNA polymerase)
MGFPHSHGSETRWIAQDCVKYRKLNAITVPETYPLPRMDECIDSLGEAPMFTTLDCKSSFWQIPLYPIDMDKTAFMSHHGLYQFTRLPFRLRNAPGSFRRTVDNILAGVKCKTCLLYLDDIIVFSSLREAHLHHVHKFFPSSRRPACLSSWRNATSSRIP